MIKTRFAPSPTGYLHVGGLRTALYNYLFARKNKGKFVLRIEDTDQERFVEGAVENLLKTLEWIGLEYDEGPYFKNTARENPIIAEKGANGPYIQSKRTEIYLKHADKLLKSGHAYRCFCTKERLGEMRKKQEEISQAPMYDRKCLDLPESEVKAKIEAGEAFVVRQKIPYETIKFKDLIRGNVQFDGKTIDDQILVKSDGFPTYHLANVIDDHLMSITHVIRGEEWLPSTPKHIALYKAFGWKIPEFAHLPLLLNEDRTKLSKRQGHVAVEDYIKEGCGKEAIINFTVFLGWNPGGGEEKEIFTLKELEEIFSLEKVHKAGAIFNLEKLDWFNWKWRKAKFEKELIKIAKEINPKIKCLKNKEGEQIFFTTDANYPLEITSPDIYEKFMRKKGGKLLEICGEYLSEKLKKEANHKKLYKALVTIAEKILKDPKETSNHINFYFKLPEYNKELLTHVKMGVDYTQALESLTSSQKDLANLDNWTQESLKQILLKTVEKLKVKNGQVFWPLRAALSGLQFSPGVFETAWVLGKEESLKRIQSALKKLQ